MGLTHHWESTGPVNECRHCGAVRCMLPGSSLYRHFKALVDPGDPEKGYHDWQSVDPGCKELPCPNS